MRIHSRLLLAAFTAALALTIGAATANAARSFSTTNNTLLTYISPRLTLDEAGELSIICDVTLTASVHATGAKTSGTLIGFTSGGRTGNCSNTLGTTTRAIVLVSHRFPWHMTLNSFRGTLPRITEVQFTIRGSAFLILAGEIFGDLGCLFRGDVAVETSGRTGAAEFTIERLRPVGGAASEVPLFEDRLDAAAFADCPARGTLIGSFTATLPPVVRLI